MGDVIKPKAPAIAEAEIVAYTFLQNLVSLLTLGKFNWAKFASTIEIYEPLDWSIGPAKPCPPIEGFYFWMKYE